MLPIFLGVEAVLAKTYARIHKENLINYGILPLVFKHKDDYDKIAEGDVLTMENVREQVDKGEMLVKIAGKDIAFTALMELSARDKAVLQAGGAINYLKSKQ